MTSDTKVVSESKPSTPVLKRKTNIVDDVVGPLFFIITCPVFALLFFRSADEYDGSITECLKALVWNFPNNIYKMPNVEALKIIASFALLQLVLLVAVPGKMWQACVSPAGLRPVYKLNGPLCYFITLGLWYIGGVHFQVFNPASVYDNFGEILTFMSFFSLLMCVVLYYKGLYFPSSEDAGSTGHIIRDFFWGTELHPSFKGYYLKQYVNCRLSMTGWIVILLCGAYKQYELYGYVSNSMLVSVSLQTLYIAKFFVWEHGYFNSIDIMHDRFGFYIYWGVTVWVPSLYTLAGTYLVKHPYQLSPAYAWFLFIGGVIALYLNYAIDEQRLRFRETSGNTTIWGKKPQYINAKYTTGDGKERSSMLLVSGFWGMSRHLNYVPEITVALFWSLPGLFEHILPYIYVLFLTGLLLHRTWRDEERCSKKYGKYYDEYKKQVPYFLIPYVY